MLSKAEWMRDDWYWAGPGDYKFEPWRPGADCAEDTRSSLKAAQKRHAEIVG
ncbi:MAG: hypothetical protein KUL86_09680 [Castellaniella sp.]|nr:hypothetical protein [Castellaniella sp.]